MIIKVDKMTDERLRRRLITGVTPSARGVLCLRVSYVYLPLHLVTRFGWGTEETHGLKGKQVTNH